ncbi:MAG: response regulator [Coleofasciculus sp. Co-bin14]|nr:response regulator [Coleofasciculus sp. Co-bin14]
MLIIEDNEILRSIIFEILELENFNVISAGDGVAGLNLAKDLKPDVIICDINMPCLDGYGVLKELRKDLLIAKIPVIFLSSETDSVTRLMALKLGADDYLMKPIRINQLLEAINNQLQPMQSVP